MTGITCKVCSRSTILCVVGKLQTVQCLNATEREFREFNYNLHYVSDQFAWGLGVLTFSGFSVAVSSGFEAAVVVSLVPKLGRNGKFETKGGRGKLLMAPRITLKIPPSLPLLDLLSSVSLRVT